MLESACINPVGMDDKPLDANACKYATEVPYEFLDTKNGSYELSLGDCSGALTKFGNTIDLKKKKHLTTFYFDQDGV